MTNYQRILTVAGVVAIVIVGYYLYKHGELGNPKDMINEAAKDGKDAAKPAPGGGGGGASTK